MEIVKVDRRDFLRLTGVASAGLILGVHLPELAAGETRPVATGSFGAFITVGTDEIVTVWLPKTEMGQGLRTAVPMIVAEEMDADWSNVRVAQAPLDDRFGDQATGGSGSIRKLWTPMREAGAKARAMLLSAAAFTWNVPNAECTLANGVIHHGDRKLTFGQIAQYAATLRVPDPELKDPAAFKIIGKRMKRADDAALVRGGAKYGIDVKVPGMLTAAILRAPLFAATVASVDDKKAREVPGVRDVVVVEVKSNTLPWSGVAVVADSTYAALRGREALDVKWQGGDTIDSAALVVEMDDATMRRVKPLVSHGDADKALETAAKKLTARYEVPFLAHATMEPMSATASVTDQGIEIWAPTQSPDWLARAIADLTDIKRGDIRVNVVTAGGSFGRRANPDFGVEAAVISDAVRKPVKVIWTREDDIQHDFYRPAAVHRIEAGVDTDGKIKGWRHSMSSASINQWRGGDASASEVGGVRELRHVIDDFSLEYQTVGSFIPRGWWRSVEHSGNAFVVHSMLDELAHAAGKDPIEFRLAMFPANMSGADQKSLGINAARMRKVIELVRQKSGWGSSLPEGRARGFAAWNSFFSYVAEVAEVSVAKDGTPRVHRVVAAVDCGTAVDPDGVAAQVEGAIAYGLSAALHGKITLTKGRVDQSNFHDYEVLRISEMPSVEVHIVPSAEAPTGMGEPALPPIAPAVGNAIFALTGKRLRTLPFGKISQA